MCVDVGADVGVDADDAVVLTVKDVAIRLERKEPGMAQPRLTKHVLALHTTSRYQRNTSFLHKRMFFTSHKQTSGLYHGHQASQLLPVVDSALDWRGVLELYPTRAFCEIATVSQPPSDRLS